MEATNMQFMNNEQVKQWRQSILNIVEDYVEGTWKVDKCIVVLRGLPGCGKSTFTDVLAAEFRKNLFYRQQSGEKPRVVRVCAAALYQVYQGRENPSTKACMEQDVKNSLSMADVVIVDDLNIDIAECSEVANAGETFWRDEGCLGKVYTVNFGCRNEEHALTLNARTWRPLSEEAIRQLYKKYAELEPELQSLRNVIIVDPDI